ncbi:MAG: hypothetical protein HQL13_05140 [Candidatus Omnitrophica bacterium]|nr:hypothetical protein [Candidatus Omnitrophota bacterium]
MKIKLTLIIAVLILLRPAAMADQTAYPVSATIPPGGITINAYAVNFNKQFLPVGAPTSVSTLPFGTLVLDQTVDPNTKKPYNVYRMDQTKGISYYAIEVAVAGAGAPDTTVTYAEGVDPTGSTTTLGSRTKATFDKEVLPTGATLPTETTLATKSLSDMTGSGYKVAYTTVAGGWLRIYVGVCGGDSTDPSTCQPFTPADSVGTYNGQLTITAVVN